MRKPNSKMRLLPLIGATYFMVAGGPYGLEDILGDAGYGRALLLLLLIPLVWSLPTALMVGELASALPQEGGYYCWVRRALGPFWGFQEAWLSLAASVFDMAIYPVIFVLYLSRVAPSLTSGSRATLWELAVVLACAAWNLRGAKSVGEGSIGFFAVLLAPFVVLVAVGFWKGLFAHATGLLHPHATTSATRSPCSARPSPRPPSPVPSPSLSGTTWDGTTPPPSPRRWNPRSATIPRAMLISAALVALTYIVPLAAVGIGGIPAGQFTTGAWTDAARTIAGPGLLGTILALAVVLGGMLNGAGMFNALMMSYARVPYALAQDGLLPRFLTRTTPARPTRAPVPWASVLSAPPPGPWRFASPSSASSPSTSSSTGPPSCWSSSPSSSSACVSPPSPAPSASPAGYRRDCWPASAPPCSSPLPSLRPAAERVGPFPALAFAALVAALGPLAYRLGPPRLVPQISAPKPSGKITLARYAVMVVQFLSLSKSVAGSRVRRGSCQA